MRIAVFHFSNPGGYPPLIRALQSLSVNESYLRLISTERGAIALTPINTKDLTLHEQRILPASNARMAMAFALIWLLWQAIVLRKFRPKWIYASDPLSLPAALLAKFVTGARLLYQEHDSPEVPRAGDTLSKKWMYRVRCLALRSAHLVLMPNQQRITRAREQAGPGKGEDMVLWNAPCCDEIAAAKSISNRIDKKLVLHYHGSMAPVRVPFALLDALAVVPEAQFQFAAYELQGKHIQALLDYAKKLGISERVHYLGHLKTRLELMESMKNAHVGLNFLSNHPGNTNHFLAKGASNKTFEYMANGLALLCSEGEQWKNFVLPDFGLAADAKDSVSIATALRAFVESRPDPVLLGELARKKILSEWNFEDLFAPVFRKMHS